MLEQLARHSLIDITLKAKGDLHIDFHHTTEDTGIVLGQAVAKALGDKQGITRYAYVHLPMDETLTRVAIDVSGRPYLIWKVAFSTPKIGEMDTELFREWFQAFAQNAGITLHVETLYGEQQPPHRRDLLQGARRAPCARRSRSTRARPAACPRPRARSASERARRRSPAAGRARRGSPCSMSGAGSLPHRRDRSPQVALVHFRSEELIAAAAFCLCAVEGNVRLVDRAARHRRRPPTTRRSLCSCRCRLGAAQLERHAQCGLRACRDQRGLGCRVERVNHDGKLISAEAGQRDRRPARRTSAARPPL